MTRLVHLILVMVLLTAATESVADPCSTPDQTKHSSGMVDAILEHARGHSGSLRYEQVKRMKALSRPLLSRGTLHVVPGREVKWVQTEPFPQVVTVTPTGVFRDTEEGRQPLAPKNAPHAREISDAFLSLFSGSRSDLERVFSLASRQDPPKWELSLTPRSSTLSRVLTRISLSGHASMLERVWICEAHGDSLEIKFSAGS